MVRAEQGYGAGAGASSKLDRMGHRALVLWLAFPILSPSFFRAVLIPAQLGAFPDADCYE